MFHRRTAWAGLIMYFMKRCCRCHNDPEFCIHVLICTGLLNVLYFGWWLNFNICVKGCRVLQTLFRNFIHTYRCFRCNGICRVEYDLKRGYILGVLWHGILKSYTFLCTGFVVLKKKKKHTCSWVRKYICSHMYIFRESNQTVLYPFFFDGCHDIPSIRVN